MTDDARARALEAIDQDPVLRALLERVRPLLADDDPGHDLEHCLRVAGWTLRCGADPREGVAAALLHDVVNLPKNDPRRKEASALSATKARELLGALDLAADAIERIADAVEDHSYSRGATPRSPLGEALQDADRLEAVGALGLFRIVSTGTRMGARYFDSSDPWATHRPYDDLRFTVDHFFTKLLRLPATFHTDVGRREAERRVAFMRVFLEQLGAELGRPSPDGAPSET